VLHREKRNTFVKNDKKGWEEHSHLRTRQRNSGREVRAGGKPSGRGGKKGDEVLESENGSRILVWVGSLCRKKGMKVAPMG